MNNKTKDKLKVLEKMKREKNKSLSQPGETERCLESRNVIFDNLVDALLSEDVGSKERISLFRGVLLKLLSEYVSVAEMTAKRRSQDIMSSFRRLTDQSEIQVESNRELAQKVSEILSLIKDDGRESFFRPVISRLVCMYNVFAKSSDEEGAKKCQILAKDLLRSKNNTPERLVLSVLKQRALRRGEKIPPDERELLYKYTF